MHAFSKQLSGLTRGVLAVTLSTALTACAGYDAGALADTNAPAEWSAVAVRAVLNASAAVPGGVSPMEESRAYAMAFTAMHDALNAIERRYKPYLSDLQAPDANPDAAVAAAISNVLKAALPSQASALDVAYVAALAQVADGSAKTAGIALGQKTAQAILSARASDGSAQAQGPYTPASTPGAYQFTPPFDFAAFVNWGGVKPFVVSTANQFRAAAPYALTDAAYTIDFVEVKALGSAGSTTRTAEQTQIARFWLENTPMSWQRIAVRIAADKKLNGWDQARLFALLQVAQADAYVASFDSKYFYKFWRPISAIRAAASDGNADTTADAGWTSLEPSPPIPDHASGHAAAAGAGAAVLMSVFTDAVSFVHQSETLPGVTRSFTSVSQAEQEIGLSRIYVGFHFRRAVTEGFKQGRLVGDWAVQHTMGKL